jgi:hypothetical protein
MVQGCSTMMEQVVTSTNKDNSKKINTEIKNNLQGNDNNQEAFAMLLSSHINKKDGKDIKALEKDSSDVMKSLSKVAGDKDNNLSKQLVDETASKALPQLQMTNSENSDTTKTLSEELLSTINSKIDKLKNIQAQNNMNGEATKANIKLQNIYNELKTKQEFSEIRSVNDLVKIANKSGLNLQNLSIEKMEEAIKSTQDKKVTISDLINSQSNMTKDALEKNKKESTQERLDTLKKVIDKNTQTETNKLNQLKENLPQIGDMHSRLDTKQGLNNQDYKKEVVKDFSSKLNSLDNSEESIDSLNTLKKIIKDNSDKIDAQKATQDNSKLPKEVSTTESGIQNAKEQTKDTNLDETKRLKKEETLREEVKKEINKEFTLSSILNKNLEEEQKSREFSLNSLLNKITSKKDETNSKVDTTSQKLDETFQQLSKEFNLDNIDNKSMRLDTNKTDTDFVAKTVKAKETIKRFVSDLETKLQDYKPPLMKIELELKPQNLGTVDVTVVSRGNNLSIQLSSNSQALQMFMQNQDEFRNALSELGFSDVKMDFNSSDGSSAGNSNSNGQENSGSNQNQRSTGNSYYTQDKELIQENKIESIEITIPQYI